MTDFFQLLFSGMATGCIYGLAALGFTLLWQAAGTINFAQGEFVMLPAFAMLGFMAMGAPFAVSKAWQRWPRWWCWVGCSSAAWSTRFSNSA